MRELRPGIWHWQAPHPDWEEGTPWSREVSSYAIELGSDLVLFDPLSVPDELRERATAVVLTAPYHERDARGLGLPVHTPPADTWQDWVEKFGVDPDQVRGMESEDLAWLRAGEAEGHFHGPGAWPFGIQAYAGREENDLVLWLPSINAIVSGDSLSDFGDGLDIQPAVASTSRATTWSNGSGRCSISPSSSSCRRTASPWAATSSSACSARQPRRPRPRYAAAAARRPATRRRRPS